MSRKENRPECSQEIFTLILYSARSESSRYDFDAVFLPTFSVPAVAPRIPNLILVDSKS